jgi:peptidyl-prolyl cis-trans isomerase-like 2
MGTNEIIRLHMAKNPDGHWHCPVVFKVFNNNTHIVAIRTTGNVYSYEAVQELNIKPNHYADLLTGEPFHRSDIITLQNPDDVEHLKLRDLNNFKYLQMMRDDAAENSRTEIRHNTTSERVIQEFEKKQKENEIKSQLAAAEAEAAALRRSTEENEDVNSFLQLRPTTEDINPGHMMLDQRTSRSFTSTSLDVHTESKIRLATADEIREARWRYMRQVNPFCFLAIFLSLPILP